jgi:aminobenzoyl-glutamate transport protein
MVVSTFFIATAGTLVTEKLVEPRLGPYEGHARPETLEHLDTAERRGLRWALVAGTVFVGLLLLGTVPADGFLRNPETGGLLHSPFLSGIVAFIFLGGSAVGIAYGMGAGTIRSDADVMKGMGGAMSTLGGYMVLVFFAAQFVAYFNWTNLGLIVAVKGAGALKASGLGGVPLMLGFVLISAFINLFMGSASAKWAVMAPVFVPMLMLLGYTPELTQAAYRIGDSTSNIIAPMMSYFALIVAFFERYDKRSGIGTVVATMLPYTVTFLIVWSVLLIVWMVLGLPVGPGAVLRLPS